KESFTLVLSRREQVDHPHDPNASACIFGSLWQTLVAAPHIALLNRKRHAWALGDMEFTLGAMTHHVVRHGSTHRFCLRLIHGVAHGDGLVPRNHRLTLA